MSFKPVELDDAAAELFDKLERNRKGWQRYCAARRELERQFGKANLAQLPDGRLITRTQNTLPQKSFSSFSEILPWDA